MNLVDGRQFGFGKKCGDGEPAVAGNRFGIVVASKAHVEPGAFADGHSAAPAKEAVREAPEANRSDDLDVAHSIFRMMMSSSA
jgi:hypothetical protein